jgi:hypothetical protein
VTDETNHPPAVLHDLPLSKLEQIMRNSFSQAALTLLVAGLTFTALSDRSLARGGGGGGGSKGGSFSSSHSSVRPSYSYSRPSSMSSNNSRAFHPTSFNSFSAFSKNSGKPSNLASKPFNGSFSKAFGQSSFNTSGKNSYGKNSYGKNSYGKNSYGKYGYGKYAYGKYGKYGKYRHSWYGYWYPWYSCGGCCDYSCYCDSPYDSSCCSCDGYTTCGDATFADVPSDPAADAPVATAPSLGPSASQVLIVNPAENQSTLAYSINGQSFTLKAGERHRLDGMPDMTIEFDRGLSGDPAKLPLTAGTYTFKATDKGWDLVSDSPSASPTPDLVLSAPQNGLVVNGPQPDPGIGVPQTSLAADATPAGPSIDVPQTSLSAGIRRK